MPTYDINIGNRTYTTKQYSDLPTDLSGYVPTTRELTINGVTYDLSADRTWSIDLADLPYVEKTANYTLTSNDYTVNCTANSFTITLPTAVGITGRAFEVTNTGTGIITIATTGGQTISDETNQYVYQDETLVIKSTGVNWIVAG